MTKGLFRIADRILRWQAERRAEQKRRGALVRLLAMSDAELADLGWERADLHHGLTAPLSQNGAEVALAYANRRRAYAAELRRLDAGLRRKPGTGGRPPGIPAAEFDLGSVWTAIAAAVSHGARQPWPPAPAPCRETRRHRAKSAA